MFMYRIFLFECQNVRNMSERSQKKTNIFIDAMTKFDYHVIVPDDVSTSMRVKVA